MILCQIINFQLFAILILIKINIVIFIIISWLKKYQSPLPLKRKVITRNVSNLTYMLLPDVIDSISLETFVDKQKVLIRQAGHPVTKETMIMQLKGTLTVKTVTHDTIATNTPARLIGQLLKPIVVSSGSESDSES